jgi:hypothetical protein
MYLCIYVETETESISVILFLLKFYIQNILNSLLCIHIIFRPNFESISIFLI